MEIKMKNNLNRATLEVKISADCKVADLQKALSFYVDDSDQYATSIRNLIEKQPDLFYGVSVLVSEGTNKNSDVFLRNKLLEIFKSPRHKFIDYEHDEAGNNFVKNPKRYKVIGHIYDSAVSMQESGEIVPEDQIAKGDDGEYFSWEPAFKNKSIDIVVAWVIYKFLYPELVNYIIEGSTKDPDHFGVSMEILFSDYKFRIGGPVDPTEDFEDDGNQLGYQEVVKGEKLAEMFQKDWQKGKWRTYEGKSVVRVLGGEMFFSGMAITANRANARSWNLSVGSQQLEEMEPQADSEVMGLLHAIANKSEDFEMTTCKIEQDGPDCDCIEKALAAESESIRADIDYISKALAELMSADAIKKRKDVNPKSGEHKYGDVKYADPKNKKYPIDTEEQK